MEPKLSFSSDWIKIEDQHPDDGQTIIALVDKVPYPLLCKYEEGVFYQTHLKLHIGLCGYKVYLEKVEGSVRFWNGNLGLKID